MKTFIQNQHEEYNLEKSQFSSAKQYMDKVMYEIPLEKLYRVIASCQYEENSDFCPVLVKIISPEIRKIIDEKEQSYKYLL